MTVPGCLVATMFAPTSSGSVLGSIDSIIDPGTGYVVGDALTVVGGDGTAATLIIINISAGGVVVTANVDNPGFYSTYPTNPVAVTGGSGSNFSFNVVIIDFYYVDDKFTLLL